jgi:hypothetical protein
MFRPSQEQRLLTLIENELPQHKKAVVRRNATLLIELLKLLSESSPSSSLKEPDADRAFLTDLLVNAPKIREKLYEEGLLQAVLARGAAFAPLLNALEEDVLASERRHNNFYNTVIHIISSLKILKEAHHKTANLSSAEKKAEKKKLAMEQAILERQLLDEKNYLSFSKDKIDQEHIQNEIRVLKDSLADSKQRVAEMDHPLPFNPVKAIQELFDVEQLQKVLQSGFDLAVLLSSQGKESQKSLLSLLPQEWLNKKITTVFELNKLLGELLPDNQRALLRKLELNHLIRTPKDVDVVLAGVPNRKEMELFLKEELRRSGPSSQADASSSASSSLKAERGTRSQLFPVRGLQLDLAKGRSVDEETLSRIIKSEPKGSPRAKDQGSSAEPHLPNQPQIKMP